MIVTRRDKLCLLALPFLLIVGFLLFNLGSETTASVKNDTSNPIEVSMEQKDISSINASFVNSEDIPEFQGHALLPELAESMGRQDSAYHIKDAGNGAFKADSPELELKAEFGASDVTLKRNEGGTIKISLSGAKKVAPVKTSDSRVEYQRGNLTEWYINSPFGLEQGFTFNERPEDLKEGDKLIVKVDFEVSSELDAVNHEPGKSVKISDKITDEALRYGKLFVFDSNGKQLPASMVYKDNSIILAVDDTDAKYPVVIDPLIEIKIVFEDQILTAGVPESEAKFGRCVDLDGDFAIIGEPKRDVQVCRPYVDSEGQEVTPDSCDTIQNAGAAYIFERMGFADWQQIAMFTDDHPQHDALFGYSCALKGDLAIAGIPHFVRLLLHSPNQGVNNNVAEEPGSEASASEICAEAQTVEGCQALLCADITDNEADEADCLGAVPDGDLSELLGQNQSEGDILTVRSGAACVFTRDGSWTDSSDCDRLIPLDLPFPNTLPNVIRNGFCDTFEFEDAHCGLSVEIKENNNTAIVGCPFANEVSLGTITVKKNGCALLCGCDGDCGFFTCDADCDIIDVCDGIKNKETGFAFIFEEELLAASEENSAEFDFNDWLQVQMLKPDKRYDYDFFGRCVGIDNGNAIVGAPGDNICASGVIHGSANAEEENSVEDVSDEVSVDGICPTEFLKDAGSAYLFFENGGWPMFPDLMLTAGPYEQSYAKFGFSCDIWSDNRAIVGAPYEDEIKVCGEDVTCDSGRWIGGNEGAAYIFESDSDKLSVNGGTPREFPLQRLYAPDAYDGDKFGFSVSIFSDSALVGSPYDNVPCEQQPDNPYCVCLNGDNACPTSADVTVEDFIGNRDQGSAYRFLRGVEDLSVESNGGPWFLEDKLLASDGYDYDRFGKDVSNTDLYCLVGAPEADIETNGEKGVCPDSAGDSEENSIDGTDGSNSVNNGCGPKDQGKAYIYEKGNEPVIITGFGGPGGKFVALENKKNKIFITGAPSGSKISFIFGFKKGTGVVQKGTCSGTEVKINPFKPLGTLKANANGNINGKKIFIPNVGKAQFLFLQGVVINSGNPCIVTPRIKVFLLND